MIDAEKLVRATLEEAAKAAYAKGVAGDGIPKAIRAIDPATIIARVAPAEPVAEVANSDRGLEVAPWGNLMRVWHVGMRLYAGPVVAAPEPVDEEAERAEFEAWIVTTRFFKIRNPTLRQNRDGSYSDFRVNDRWGAWQAGRAALREGK